MPGLQNYEPLDGKLSIHLARARVIISIHLIQPTGEGISGPCPSNSNESPRTNTFILDAGKSQHDQIRFRSAAPSCLCVHEDGQ